MEEEQKQEEKLNIVEEAKKIRDEILSAKNALKEENDRRDLQKSEDLLAGNTGGHIEKKTVSPEEQKINNAKEFWKGSSLEDAINKANG